MRVGLIHFVFFAIFSSAFAQTGSLTIRWDANTEPDISKYRLERAINSTTNFQTLQEIEHPNTAFTDRAIHPGDLYAYRVSAINSNGEASPYSRTASVGIPQINLALTEVSSAGETVLSKSAFLNDPDSDVNDIQLQFSDESHVSISIQNDEVRISAIPENYTGSAEFVINATDAGGFFDQKTITFQFVAGDVTPIITQEEAKLLVYPNPIKTSRGHNEMIFLNLPENTQSIDVFSVTGDRVYKEEILQTGLAEHRINVSNSADQFPSGLYVYMVRGENSKILEKGRVVIIR